MTRSVAKSLRWMFVGLSALAAVGLVGSAMAQSAPMTPIASSTATATPSSSATALPSTTTTALASLTPAVPPIASSSPLPTDQFINAFMTGANEVPPVADTGTPGSFRAAVTDGQVCFTLGAEGPGLTGVRIFHGGAGSNGDAVADLFTDMSGISAITTSGCIVEANLQGSLAGDWQGFVDALYSGGLYVNVASLAHPGGAMRGQILTGTDRFMPTIAPTPHAPIVGSGPAFTRPSDIWFFGGSIAAMLGIALVGGWVSLSGRK